MHNKIYKRIFENMTYTLYRFGNASVPRSFFSYPQNSATYEKRTTYQI
jgi:hypothetical protein